jgi:hypothetical protein
MGHIDGLEEGTRGALDAVTGAVIDREWRLMQLFIDEN